MNCKRVAGFTLIEMLIVVAIAGILAGLAYASYSSSVQKSRRTDAKDALLQAAARQGRFFLRSNRYSGDINDVSDGVSAEGYYGLVVSSTNASLNGPCNVGGCYVLSATAGGAQAADTQCAIFRIDNLGRRDSLDSGGNDTTDDCW